jgi:monoamine oxidase
MAIESISNIFNISQKDLTTILNSSKVFNWTADPFTMGAYAYKTPQSKEALKLMEKPFNDILYFAGEAYFTGTEMGTVEAALVSGYNTSKKI